MLTYVRDPTIAWWPRALLLLMFHNATLPKLTPMTNTGLSKYKHYFLTTSQSNSRKFVLGYIMSQHYENLVNVTAEADLILCVEASP